VPGISPASPPNSPRREIRYKFGRSGAAFDWQDGESQYGSYAYTAKLMGYMITHR
jgi:hypothetical protein